MIRLEHYFCPCGSEFSRPAARGQRPRWCPACAANSVGRKRRWRRGRGIQNRAEAAMARRSLVLASPRRRAETLAYRAAAGRLAKAAEGTRSKRVVWVGATCYRCGAAFICMWTGALPRFCSRACGRASSKAARRQLGGQRVPYRRIDIFERDRWACRLCGKRVKRRAAVPDPRAPVIDHIVPLAAGPELGGVDAPWNVQCAHFLCNSIKSASFAQPALALEVA